MESIEQRVWRAESRGAESTENMGGYGSKVAEKIFGG